MNDKLKALTLSVVVLFSVISGGAGFVAAQSNAGNAAGNVSVTDYSVGNTTVDVGESVTVTATVENVGSSAANATVEFIVDNQTAETRNVSVGANATTNTTFQTSFGTPGPHTVAVNDLAPTTITVQTPPPQNGTITGTVVDDDTGLPIENATVAVGGPDVSATTDANGIYTLSGLLPGPYNVVASAEEYKPTFTTAVVRPGNTTTLDLELDELVEQSSDEAELLLDGAPNGLQSYNVTINIADEASGTHDQLRAHLLPSDTVQVLERTDTTLSFRVADLGETIGSFEEQRKLTTFEFTGPVEADELSLEIHGLVDDNGDPINQSRLSLELNLLFENPLPGAAADDPPLDPDDDGLFEDIDGDGEVDFTDAISLAFVDYDALSAEQQAALDFDGDGEVTFADAIELAFQV